MPSGVSKSDIADVRSQPFHVPLDGELVKICGHYRGLMADPRHGSVGPYPYVDPGPGPLMTVRTFWDNEDTPVAEVLLSDGSIRTIECIYIRPFDGSEVNYGVWP